MSKPKTNPPGLIVQGTDRKRPIGYLIVDEVSIEQERSYGSLELLLTANGTLTVTKFTGKGRKLKSVTYTTEDLLCPPVKART